MGAALSMTYVTGQPIIFVGCGQVGFQVFINPADVNSSQQTYTDLRQLRVANVVEAILKD